MNIVEISRSALAHNYHYCQRLASNTPIMAMVKADAYGHGLDACGPLFARLGVDSFGVAELSEAIALRQQGVSQPILLLCGIDPADIALIKAHRLTPVVMDRTLLRQLSATACQHQEPFELQLKVDAGMGRQGCLLSQAETLIQEIQALPGLRLTGVMAHLPMGDETAANNTRYIYHCFQPLVEKMRRLAHPDCRFHLANSGGLFHCPAARLDLVRLGIALYGYHPDGNPAGTGKGASQLQPAMRFVSRLVQCKTLPKGTGIGYGHCYTTQRLTQLGIVPVGYANGYSRLLSNRAQVLIHGQRVPVIGRVSMNLIMVDLTDLNEVAVGDEVVLLGHQGEEKIGADELGQWFNTISYEVICLFGNLNKRVYID